jgi:clan AA aspartic protease
VIGHVDDKSRALLEIPIASGPKGPSTYVTTWIDTAFDGHLVFSRSLIDELGLDTLVETEAILADGSKVQLATYLCYIDWFEQRIPVQVIANEGKYPLLGTGLLERRVLHIDYGAKELRLD